MIDNQFEDSANKLVIKKPTTHLSYRLYLSV